MQPNIENFIGCDSSYRAASIVLYGAPYDSTTSYRPGARFGPAAIRHESYGLETYSPYQNADLTDFDIFDSGDLELCFGSSESALADIEARAEEILQDGKFPLLLGGEHLVTLGAVRAAVKKYPDLHIVHFDAHADLRDDYLGAKLSHACVLRRCQTTTAAAESTEGVIEFDNLRLDMNSYELRVKGKVVEAPPKELELLNCLASHPNRVYTRDQLLDEVWGFEYYGDSRTIDVHVKRLREKLAGASDKWELKTVWGVGYKFEVRQ